MFIVLEGLDGAGKSTQIKLLREMVEQAGWECEYLHFPRFDAPVYGDLIARFLRGEFGSVEQVNPYLVALLYAGDRADAAKLINGWMAEGKCVICDRYVYSNVGYQCAKVASEEERKALTEWILKTEFEEFSIPRPTLSLFLDVPFAFTEAKLTAAREQIIKEMAIERPRFNAAFDNMRIEGNKIHVVVHAATLENDLRQSKSEILDHIAEIAQIDGILELEIELQEIEVRLRPVKLEDRVRHIEQSTPNFNRLRELLDLEAD
jgi:dTMP kinase